MEDLLGLGVGGFFLDKSKVFRVLVGNLEWRWRQSWVLSVGLRTLQPGESFG